MAVNASLREIAEKRERAERLESDSSTLSAEVVRLEQEHRQLRGEAIRIREAANQAEVLRTELDARQNELESVRTRLKTVNADLEALARARTSLATARDGLAEARKAANEQRRIELELGNRLQEIERTLAGADESLTRFHADRQRTQDLLKLRQLRRDADELEKHGKRVVKQANERKRLEKLRTGTPDLSPARLRKLEDLADSIREKQTQLQALGLSVELAPSVAAKITVVEGGAKRSLSVGKGHTETLKAPQALELQLHDWGRISIRSGATELKSLAGELAGAEGRLKAALLEAGVVSLDEGRNVVAVRKDLEHQIRASESLQTELLGNFESLDQLQAAAGAARSKVEAMLKTVRPTAAEEKSSLTDLETSDEELRIKIRSQESLREQLAEELREQKGKVKRASDDRQTAEKQAAAGAASLQGLESQISAFQQRYPEGVEQAKEQAGQAFVEAEARLKATRQRLPADFEKLPERNRRAASALQQVEDDLNAKRDSFQKVKGSLEVLGAEGLYGKETQLVEKQAVALTQRDLARDRGWAARLAHDLLERRKQAATRAVLAPIEARLTSSFAEVTADLSRSVFLDENLQIRGVGATPDALVPYDHLSQGAREQLLLCLRLAVAEELSAAEPHTLILDDVLVNTDSVRQQRVLDLLQATARKFQVLVVSCHPERYRGVGQIVQIQR